MKIRSNKKQLKLIFKKFINEETVKYAIFGVVTAVINIGLYQILVKVHVDYKKANFVAVVSAKLVAYICNKIFVFKSKNDNFIEFCKEFLRFIVARGATMFIDYFGVILVVEILNFNQYFCKYFVSIFVIILNYFIGKEHVFKHRSNIK